MVAETLLQRRESARLERRLTLQADVRRQLRQALEVLIPGSHVWVFGSLTQPGRFNDASDVDVALEGEPPGISMGQLSSELTERLARPVDVVLLRDCRFRSKITREGEMWTL